jgi:hypothetical protein
MEVNGKAGEGGRKRSGLPGGRRAAKSAELRGIELRGNAGGLDGTQSSGVEGASAVLKSFEWISFEL